MTFRCRVLHCSWIATLAGVGASGQAGAPEPASVLSELAASVPMLHVNLNNYKYHGNPILAEGKGGQWDEGGIERAVVIRLANKDWRMWFGGLDKSGSIRIGLATSTDGIHWSRHAANPVLRPSEKWEGDRISPTSVVYANGNFHLYYWGPGHVRPPLVKRIGLAVSRDGVEWTKRGVVLDAEPGILNEAPAQGGSGVDAAKVFYFHETGAWRMIFTAFGPHGVWNGLAESRDGIHWAKRKAPLATVGGLHNRFDENFLGRGMTLRCPIQIGSLWVGLAPVLGSGEAIPIIGLSLEQWFTLGRRVLYSNQDYEQPAGICASRKPPVGCRTCAGGN